jgi:hypothetical protein
MRIGALIRLDSTRAIRESYLNHVTAAAFTVSTRPSCRSSRFASNRSVVILLHGTEMRVRRGCFESLGFGRQPIALEARFD